MTATFTTGPARQAAAVARHHAARAAQTRSLVGRLVEAFLAEPDRQYADDLYGSMLREAGVDTERLRVLA